MTTQAEAVAAARRHRRDNAAAILRSFTELLAIPNMSRDLPGVRRNAEAIADSYRGRGVAVETAAVDGAPPIVLGRIDADADRTIGIYVHYDGQPADPAEWVNDPWEPTLYTAAVAAGGVARPLPEDGEDIDPDWRIYARSAADDKAPIAALGAALDGLATAGIEPTSNVVLLFEGEEEIGSPHLKTYLEMHADRLAADAWLICDGPVHYSGRPQVVFGIRGITEMEITVYGPVRDLHSGHYGNWAPNPALRLAALLATMKDPDGNVLVDGFYDGTAPVTDRDRAALAALPSSDDDLRAELGVARAEAGNAPLAERVLIPSLNIRGLAAGGVGEGARNVVPSQATASLDIRLAPGNDPAEMLDRVAAHVTGLGYHVVDHEPDAAVRAAHPLLARLERTVGYPGSRVPVDSPLAIRLLGAAAAASGDEPVAVPALGGSVPIHAFTDVLGSPVIIMPMANHDNSQHAADENLRIGNLWYGIDMMAALLTMPA